MENSIPAKFDKTIEIISTGESYTPENRPKRSQTLSKLFAALSKAQGQMQNAEKDAKGVYGKYATLATTWDAIRKPMADNEISVLQRILTIEKKPFMATMICHSSGEFIDDCELELKFETNGRMTAMQAMGSAVTYARRYSLQAVSGIAPMDDDDGAGADGKGKKDESGPQNNSVNNGNDNKGSKTPNNNVKAKDQKPATKPASEKDATKPVDHTPASPELCNDIADLIVARGLTEKTVNELVTKVYKWTKGGMPKFVAEELLKFLSNPEVNETNTIDRLKKLEAARKAAVKAKDTTDPKDYVIPMGDFKGKKISELSEGTLKSIATGLAADFKLTPPPKDIGVLIECNTKIKSFLNSVGVQL